MSPMVRVGGRATLDDGGELTWSVADGRRGRRWRGSLVHGDALLGSLLLETGVDERFVRLELATAAGLLTLHPEAGSLHGNVVTADGITHVTLAWSDDHGLEIDGFAIAAAVTAGRLAPSMAVGEGRTVPVVAVGLDLAVRAVERHYARIADTTWRIVGDGLAATLVIDERGLPLWPAAVGEWPLELESPASDR